MSIYTGIKKRWVEGDYAGSLRPGEEGVEIRSPLFSRYLGRENVLVKNVGSHKNGIPKPLIIATDLLRGELDSKGNQVSGESNGLYYPSLGSQNEMTIEPLRVLLQRAESMDMLTVLPGDQHENPGLFDLNRLTTTILDSDLSLLSKREEKIVRDRFSRWIGRRLPAGIWREIFMNSTKYNPGSGFMGKEERNFLPHCTENQVEYLDFVLEIFERQKSRIYSEASSGAIIPRARFLPVPKDGLTVDMPGDERGMNGNRFDEILKAAWTGGYFQGDDHRHKKIAVVAGACYEYSVRLMIEHLVDADINVICLMTAVKGLDLFSSKLHTAHYLKELYGKKLFFTYDWIEPLLGPKPTGWDRMKDQVQNYDKIQHKAWFNDYKTQLKKCVTSMGQAIFENEKDLVKSAGIS